MWRRDTSIIGEYNIRVLLRNHWEMRDDRDDDLTNDEIGIGKGEAIVTTCDNQLLLSPPSFLATPYPSTYRELLLWNTEIPSCEAKRNHKTNQNDSWSSQLCGFAFQGNSRCNSIGLKPSFFLSETSIFCFWHTKLRWSPSFVGPELMSFRIACQVPLHFCSLRENRRKVFGPREVREGHSVPGDGSFLGDWSTKSDNIAGVTNFSWNMFKLQICFYDETSTFTTGLISSSCVLPVGDATKGDFTISRTRQNIVVSHNCHSGSKSEGNKFPCFTTAVVAISGCDVPCHSVIARASCAKFLSFKAENMEISQKASLHRAQTWIQENETMAKWAKTTDFVISCLGKTFFNNTVAPHRRTPWGFQFNAQMLRKIRAEGIPHLKICSQYQG